MAVVGFTGTLEMQKPAFAGFAQMSILVEMKRNMKIQYFVREFHGEAPQGRRSYLLDTRIPLRIVDAAWLEDRRIVDGSVEVGGDGFDDISKIELVEPALGDCLDAVEGAEDVAGDAAG